MCITLVETAVDWFVDAGVIELTRAGKKPTLELSEAYGGAELERLIGEIGSFR